LHVSVFIYLIKTKMQTFLHLWQWSLS